MNTAMHILISTSSAQTERQPLDLLEAAGMTYTLNPHGRKLKTEETIALLENTTGVIVGTETLDRSVLRRRLRVISRVGTGLDNIDLEAAHQLGIAVYSTPDVVVDAVAELTIGGMLSLLRHVARHRPTNSTRRVGKANGCTAARQDSRHYWLGTRGQSTGAFAPTVRRADSCRRCPPRCRASRAHGVEYVSLDEPVVREADLLTLHLMYRCRCTTC